MNDNSDFFFDALKKATEPKPCRVCGKVLDDCFCIECEDCGDKFEDYTDNGDGPTICQRCQYDRIGGAHAEDAMAARADRLGRV